MRRYDVCATILVNITGVAGECEDDARVTVQDALNKTVEEIGYLIEAGLTFVGTVDNIVSTVEDVTDDAEY